MVIEDDPRLRSGYGRVLAEAGYVVKEVGSGGDAVAAGANFSPKVVLIDMWLPDMQAIQVRDTLSRRVPACKFVFTTGAGRLEDAIMALRNGGALDFLLKPVDPDALVHAISAATSAGSAPPVDCPLTDRELEVLKLIADGHDTAGVAQALCLSILTVKNHLRNMFAKLGVRERTHAVAIALRSGWL